jgi:hypothetical protein
MNQWKYKSLAMNKLRSDGDAEQEKELVTLSHTVTKGFCR